jgi:2-polyprenyl-3-methyl-5-hydroxy-6-metoxy-1,4-benzoquinol methylase
MRRGSADSYASGMTNTLTHTIAPVDPATVQAFAGQVLTDFAGAATTAMTVIGQRLGLLEAMTGTGPVSAEQLAASTELNQRLVTEWLASQVVSGYLTYDEDADRYLLPVEHAMVLSVSESPAYLVGAAEVVTGQYATLDHLESAFRTNGAVDYAHFPDTVTHGIERFFGTAYRHQLVEAWFPAIDGLVQRLADGARVADIGCGHGAATLVMAEAWPRSVFTGFDVEERAITVARSRAVAHGSPATVEFRAADSATFGPGPYDVVVFFDALHDLGDPQATLRRARELLTPGGILVAVEPWSTDRVLESVGNPVARLNYAISASMCTPTSLAQPGGFAMGTSGGPERRLQLFTEAGFLDARLAVDTGQNLILTARAPD